MLIILFSFHPRTSGEKTLLGEMVFKQDNQLGVQGCKKNPKHINWFVSFLYRLNGVTFSAKYHKRLLYALIQQLREWRCQNGMCIPIQKL